MRCVCEKDLRVLHNLHDCARAHEIWLHGAISGGTVFPSEIALFWGGGYTHAPNITFVFVCADRGHTTNNRGHVRTSRARAPVFGVIIHEFLFDLVDAAVDLCATPLAGGAIGRAPSPDEFCCLLLQHSAFPFFRSIDWCDCRTLQT